MTSLEARVGFPRSQSLSYPFQIRFDYPIWAGVEGRKYLTPVESRRGIHGRFFLKTVENSQKARKQIDMYSFFKQHGAPVPDMFRQVRDSRGRTYLLVTDLSNGNTNGVYTPNSRESRSTEFFHLTSRVPTTNKTDIAKDLVTIARIATLGNFEFLDRAMFLVVNRSQPDECRVVMGDFGLDVFASRIQQTEALLAENIRTSAAFYAHMLGEILPLPRDLHQLQSSVDKRVNSIIRHRKRVF